MRVYERTHRVWWTVFFWVFYSILFPLSCYFQSFRCSIFISFLPGVLLAHIGRIVPGLALVSLSHLVIIPRIDAYAFN